MIPAMDTLRLTTSEDDIKTAAALLHSGELVVFPTETVYGLGASADNDEGVAGIFMAKNRPADNPLIVHVDSIDMAREYASRITDVELALLERFSPGPLTLILDRVPGRGAAAAAGHDTIGIRIPREECALRLIRALGSGIAAPSANRSGRPSPTDFSMAVGEMDGRVAAIIDGPRSHKGLESTIVRHGSDGLYILRPGTITADELELCASRVSPGMQISLPGGPAVSVESVPAAPGTRYRHYAPTARIRLFSGIDELAEVLSAESGDMREVILPGTWPRPDAENATFIPIDSIDDYAHRLYRIFVDADRRHVGELLCWLPDESVATHALRDRLIRAARG